MSTLSLTYYKTFSGSLSLSRPCFPCEEWRYTRRQSLNLITFISPLDCHSFLWDRHVTWGNLFNSCDRPSRSVTSFSFLSLMKKKSCFLFPRHKNRNQSMIPQKSLSSKDYCMKFFKDFPVLQILYHSPDTSTTPTATSSSPSTTLKPPKVNFCLSSPLYFLLEGSTRNVIPPLRM